MPVIGFSVLGAITCFYRGRDLYGHHAGLLASGLWCFSPLVLGHAALLTPDAPAAALGMLACYTFWQWLKQPTWQRTIATGLILGLAELSKMTLILFYYLYALLVKTPLGTMGLLVLTIYCRSRRIFPKPAFRDELVLLAPAIFVFAVVSSKSGFSHHLRYLFPCIPLTGLITIWIFAHSRRYARWSPLVGRVTRFEFTLPAS